MGAISVFPDNPSTSRPLSMNARLIQETFHQEDKKHEKTAVRGRKTRKIFNVGKFWRA